MSQKLTRIIESVSPENAVSPIKSKRDKLHHIWVARNRKAARTRRLLKKARAARAEAETTDQAA